MQGKKGCFTLKQYGMLRKQRFQNFYSVISP